MTDTHPTNPLFSDRHIGTDADAQTSMLQAVGYSSIEELMNAAVPTAIRMQFPLESSVIPPAATEHEALTELREYAQQNRVRRSLIGLGYYDTITPSVIKRNILENPQWYTAYTPYQPEISQGRLEALINFQTLVSDLTGLEIANASMLDEATAVVEGMLLARRVSRATSNRFIVDTDTFPQTRAVVESRAAAVGIELVYQTLAESADPNGPAHVNGSTDGNEPQHDNSYFGMFIQYPGASGAVRNIANLITQAHDNGAIVVMGADLLALTLLTPPGELGADVAVGTTQRFGVPMGFGGPHAGYMAVRKGLERQLPGRLVGVSHDADGTPAYRLSLQAREQHIRREKATSNICTAQVLLAVMASMYAVYHGPTGLRNIALRAAGRARMLADSAVAAGFSLIHPYFFDTVHISAPGRASHIVAAARNAGYLLYLVDENTFQFSTDETTTAGDVRILARIFEGITEASQATVSIPSSDNFDNLDTLDAPDTPPDYGGELSEPQLGRSHLRSSSYLTHPVFNTHHSETSMMRYMRHLADKDYALDRGMIPLGSCTMKLNAATEMEAITWPEFANIHPFAPLEDVRGYLEIIDQLETWLAEMTGYDTVSLQPNAGSQGELAGLLAIREYHRARGEEQRTVCLIPSSAHGTNAASAVLAGMRVVVVACDDNGNVDLADVHKQITAHADTLAALMITYPSTHGVYEHDVTSITEAVHDAGGQVYVDGANLNALLGYARFGDFGGDVSHLNLHKTFCIPHGGGGPGVGPVAAKAHLAPYLPGHPMAQRSVHPLCEGSPHDEQDANESSTFQSTTGSGGEHTVVHAGNPVSAAPYGSPNILPISWAYVRMMGTRGVKKATGVAVLATNYIATRLRPYFPVLYAGDNGLVAHECILDLRPLTHATGVSVDDFAKRLIDYGFHAPTMSFPVPGTLMVEPTESENLPELDRFIDAMIQIKAEVDAVAAGEWSVTDNPLRNAPHTAHSVIAGEWSHTYDRERAVYPPHTRVGGKYWPPVRRIDQAYGDRNLLCECPPVEAFASSDE